MAHKLATAIARKRKRLEKVVTGSQEPQSKKASVDTGGIDINALIDESGIVLDQQNDRGIYITISRRQCCR